MKRRIKYFLRFIIVASLSLHLNACQESFLDLKPDKKLVVPRTLQDLQALLDNTEVMNGQTPCIGEIGSDDYYVLTERWLALSTPSHRNGYVWNEDIYEGSHSNDWNIPYRQAFYANTVLEALNDIESVDPLEKSRVKGSALFYRAWAFYNLAQLFCKPYQMSTAEIDPGIPLRLQADINLPSFRSTVQETYEQIITDLKEAIRGLATEPTIKTRPGKAAGYALLARTFLSMGRYQEALLYADSCLNIQHDLIDYNDIDSGIAYPFEQFNKEVIFHCTMEYASILSESRLIVDTTLFQLYHPDDLRTKLYFTNNEGMCTYRGSYDGSRFFFSGIATAEVLLIRAESNARDGNTLQAKKDLNMLKEKRFRSGTFVPENIEDEQELLEKILEERRKELVFRGLRWTDLRRLDQSTQWAVPLTRIINEHQYRLEPNSNRYILPIPDPVIELNGIKQNNRSN